MLDYDPRLGGYQIQITAEQLRRAPSSPVLAVRTGRIGSEQDLHDYYQVSDYWVLT